MGDDENKSTRSRLFSKIQRSKSTKETSDKLNDDVVDFLKPSTEKAALLRPRIDIAIAQRWPEAQTVRTQASPLDDPQNINGLRKRRRREGLKVSFTNATPEIMGEGGDDSPYPTIEISRMKERSGRPTQQRRRSVDHTLPWAGRDTVQEQEPTPLRRANTAHHEHMFQQERRYESSRPSELGIPYSNSPLSHHDRKRSLMSANEGMALKRASSIPDLNEHEHDDDDNDEDDDNDPPPHFGPGVTKNFSMPARPLANAPSSPTRHRDEVDTSTARHYHDEANNDTARRYHRGSELSSTRQLHDEKEINTTKSHQDGNLTIEQQYSQDPSASATGYTLPGRAVQPTVMNTTQSLPDKSLLPQRTAPIPPQHQAPVQRPPIAQQVSGSPFDDPRYLERRQQASRPPQHSPQTPSQLYPGQAQYGVTSSQEQVSQKDPAYIAYAQPSQNVSTASLRSTEHSTSTQPSSTSPTAAETALMDFASRVEHMKGVFSLTAEKEHPAKCSAESWIRTATWWYLIAKIRLENELRQRAQNRQPPSGLLLQGHVDLAKAWWILTTHFEATNTSSSCTELERYMQAFCLSLARNSLLPPSASLIQGQDTRIWLSNRSNINMLHPDTTLQSLPLGDVSSRFCYSRYLVDVVLNNAQGTDVVSIPCILSITRSSTTYDIAIHVASQHDQINVNIGSDIPWSDVSWSSSMNALNVQLPGGAILHARLQPNDYRALGNMIEYTRKSVLLTQPLKEEHLVIDLTVALQYSTSTSASPFLRDTIDDCRVLLFHSASGSRIVLITSPIIKILSCVNHKLMTNTSRKRTAESTVILSFNETRGQAQAVLKFSSGESLSRFEAALSGHHDTNRSGKAQVAHDTHVAGISHEKAEVSASRSSQEHASRNGSTARMSYEQISNISPTGDPRQHTTTQDKATRPSQEHTTYDRHAQNLPRGQYSNAQPSSFALLNFDIVPTSTQSITNITAPLEWRKISVHRDHGIRLDISHLNGSFIDNLDQGKGELAFRLPQTSDDFSIQILRQQQLDFDATVDTQNCLPQVATTIGRVTQLARQQATIRIIRLASATNLLDFQQIITGFEVIYDSIASTFSISRRRSVVPIHHKWTAHDVRLQVVSNPGRSVVKVLAFMKDFDHADVMCFQVKSTDVFEKIKGDNKAKKWSVKLVDAKFSLPKHSKHDSEQEKLQRQFVNLDGLDYAEEHDDITVGFDGEELRDSFAQALPAPTTVARMITLRRRI